MADGLFGLYFNRFYCTCIIHALLISYFVGYLLREMKILKKVLNKFLSEKLHDGTVQVSGRIGALEIEGLHPLKPRGFAKSGNLSLSGKIDEQQVKISSMFTNDQVALRLRVTKMSDGIDLPRVLASEGRIVVEEWINGRVIPPFITGAISRAHQAAMATFCFGVMPPSAMFGRSL